MGPLLGNELPVPTEDGVGSDERGDFGKGTAADCFASHGQSASLIIGQPESSATELLLENSVLLSEVFDDCILLAADPTGERSNEDLPGMEDGGHPQIVARQRSIRQLSRPPELDYPSQESCGLGKWTLRSSPQRPCAAFRYKVE